MRWFAPLICLGSLIVPASRVAAAEDVDYLKQVKPLLAEKCFACHGSLKQKAGLRLDASPLIRKGGDNGPILVPGKSDESLLVHAVTGTNDVERMPQEAAPLTDAQVAMLRAWIDQGAKAPTDEPTPPDPREHWAFRPPKRPAVPSVKDAAWVRNPIDAFVAVEHEKRGLKPRPEARKAVLLRRVYLDLVGLPPTRQQLHAFLADESPDAYEKVVDELLASPRYGERWGRHWMDVWRYSDWAGYQAEVRDSQPHIWRWRDWIVESLNADKPYDQMVVEMLAGDEVAAADPQTLRATGYLVRNWYKFNRNVWLDNTVEHAGKAFLGLTLNCARCHDHKYDPLAQKEYYRFRAFFEPTNIRTDRVPGEPDTKKDGLVRIFDEKSDAQTFLFLRGDEKQPDKSAPLTPATPAVLGGSLDVKTVALPPEAVYPSLQPFTQRDLLAAAQVEIDKASAAVARSQASDAVALAKAKLAAATAGRAAVEAKIAADKAKYATPPADDAADLASAAGKAERVAALRKAEEALLAAEQQAASATASSKPGDEKAKKLLQENEKKLADAKKGLEATRAALEKPTSGYTPLGASHPATSTGRRLALARWIAGRENPLTGRVAINHIWLRHFGEPLVPTVFDFGLNGKPPTHPALLDWLAVELVDSGWGMKSIHRRIVTSSTYRMDSSVTADDAGNVAADPDNRYLWRANARRMEAEAVRDSLLHVAGRLDLTAGGPEVDEKAALTSARRSLYVRHAHEKQAVFLQVFDAASPNECYRRAETVLPQQALALANSPLSLAQSRLLAADLSKDFGAAADAATEAKFVTAAFEQVLSRPPTVDERDTCRAFLSEQAGRLADPKKLNAFTAGDAVAVKPSADPHQRARENLVHVLMNHNDFVTIR